LNISNWDISASSSLHENTGQILPQASTRSKRF
jgi:hypothetical protein